jgi:hypothetical protein
MKNLELNQMENFHGGDNCSNTESVVLGVSTGSWLLGALLVATTGGLALFAIGGAALVAGYATCDGSFDYFD